MHQADPLVCKACGGPLKIVAYVTDELYITRILDHLRAMWPSSALSATTTAGISRCSAWVYGQSATVNLKVNGIDAPCPCYVTTPGPVRLTLRMWTRQLWICSVRTLWPGVDQAVY